MKIAICDDEQKCIDDIKKCLSDYGRDNNILFDIFEFTSGEKLVEFGDVFDIAFLDIEMDNIDGIKVGRKLKEKNQDIVIICVTAYNHYLDDALDLGIVRFFDKPINRDRFMKGIDKAVSMVDEAEVGFRLKDEDSNIFEIKRREIIFVEITGRTTTVHTKTRSYKSYDSIKEWERNINRTYFLTPHKSYLINANYITYYCREYVVLCGEYQIPIAYHKRSQFRHDFIKIMENY